MSDENITPSATKTVTPLDTTNAVIDAMLEKNLTLKGAVATLGLTVRQFFNIVSSEREASQRYARAMEFQADLLADELKEIADTERDAAIARNKIDVRKWLASKYAPKRFGERIDVNVSQTVSIDAALLEAKQRLLRPVSDQREAIDVQVLESLPLNQPQATDFESGGQTKTPAPAAPGDDEPDIFG